MAYLPINRTRALIICIRSWRQHVVKDVILLGEVAALCRRVSTWG